MSTRALIFRNRVAIKADAKGNAPKEIMLLRSGAWSTPWHGDFEISPSDIAQTIQNFDAGVALVEADKKAPINYGHDMGGKAAAWMTRLFASGDGTELWAEVEWTPEGQKAIKDGEYRYISSEFNPRGRPWEDPEQEYSFVDNVLTGAALTNIPLFKKLKPIMASAVKGTSDKSKQGEAMNLKDILAKKADELTAEEKTFLEEHKSELTADQLETFGLAEAETPEEKPAEAPAAATPAPVAASAAISASDLAKLKADAAAGREAQRKLAEKEASDFVDVAIKAGQVKSDQREAAIEMLLASEGDQRNAIEAFITGLPQNALIASGEIGSGADSGDAGSAEAEVHEKTVEAVRAAADNGKDLGYAAARKQVLKADSGLAERVKQEKEGA